MLPMKETQNAKGKRRFSMFNIRCRNIRNQILKCRAQCDDHIFLVAIGLKEKLNKSA